jgi:hypothetical protein
MADCEWSGYSHITIHFSKTLGMDHAGRQRELTVCLLGRFMAASKVLGEESVRDQGDQT